MELLLWRHAEAEDGAPDSARALTLKGEKQAARMAAFLRPRLPDGTRILVSPAQRTQQTAQALGLPFITESAIAPGASPEAVIAATNWHAGAGCVLVVGHQPTLGGVASILLAQQEHYWSIKKGALWWLVRRERADARLAQLRLVISPEHV